MWQVVSRSHKHNELPLPFRQIRFRYLRYDMGVQTGILFIGPRAYAPRHNKGRQLRGPLNHCAPHTGRDVMFEGFQRVGSLNWNPRTVVRLTVAETPHTQKSFRNLIEST